MINKLIEKIQKTNAPIVVGLDPMLNYTHTTRNLQLYPADSLPDIMAQLSFV